MYDEKRRLHAMKKTLTGAVVATMLVAASIPVKANDFPLGSILGGVAGGFIGNQFGKGTGKTIATALGAVGGILLGKQLHRPPHHVPSPHYANRTPTTVVTTSCDAYRNPGARAACSRGVADRNKAYQRRVENQAYRAGRGTHIYPNSRIGQRSIW
jgi:hypothetical protein|tara:strand:- start:1338 stop:1805 length:468 start_codon:yes stop_codon:yes gene_type:complete